MWGGGYFSFYYGFESVFSVCTNISVQYYTILTPPPKRDETCASFNRFCAFLPSRAVIESASRCDVTRRVLESDR